jgi:hypothetical protein
LFLLCSLISTIIHCGCKINNDLIPNSNYCVVTKRQSGSGSLNNNDDPKIINVNVSNNIESTYIETSDFKNYPNAYESKILGRDSIVEKKNDTTFINLGYLWKFKGNNTATYLDTLIQLEPTDTILIVHTDIMSYKTTNLSENDFKFVKTNKMMVLRKTEEVQIKFTNCYGPDNRITIRY